MKSKRKSFLGFWLIIFICWLPVFAAFYPAIVAYDINRQWSQFFVAGSGYSTHHPILHTILMGEIIRIGKDIFGDYNKAIALYALLQLIVLSGVVAYALVRLWERCTGNILRKVYVVVTLYYVLMPIYPILGVSTTKDVYFSICFLWAYVELSRFCREELKEWKNMTGLVFALVCSQLFRNNMVYGLVLLLLFAFVVSMNKKKKKKLIFALVLSLLVAKGFSWGLIYATSAEKGSIAEALSVPCQQLAKVYCEKAAELSAEVKEELYLYIPEENLCGYRPQLSDPVKDYLNTEYVKQSPMKFLRLWIRLGFRYPKEYVQAFLDNSQPLWNLADTSMVTIHDVYLETWVKKINGEQLVERNSFLPALETFYNKELEEGQILQIPVLSLLFRPAFYFWIIVVITMMFIRKGCCSESILAIYLLGYCVTLFGGPCILLRYCMNFMLCTPLLVCSWLERRKVYALQ